jgi:hypothetical protein
MTPCISISVVHCQPGLPSCGATRRVSETAASGFVCCSMTPGCMVPASRGVLHDDQARPDDRVSSNVHRSASPRTKSHLSCCRPLTAPNHQGKARTSRPVTLTIVRGSAPPCLGRAKQAQTKTPTRVHVAAKGCLRCYNTYGSLRCYSSPQSKPCPPSISQFTPPAASSLPPTAATFTTTNTTHLSLSSFYTALYAIPVARLLFKDSPLSLPSPSSFSLPSLPQSHQSNLSHIRNDG